MPTVTRTLAAFATATGPEQVPAAVRHQAARCLLDTLGAALAGSRHADSGRMIQDVVAEFDEPPIATVIGSGMHKSAMTAALANAVMAHALELDDGSKHATYHPGCSIVPTALALGEEFVLSITHIARAIALGYEVSLRIGSAINPSHYLKGFHPTGTIAHFGTTTTAGLLLGLSEDQLVNALGLAGSMASGVNQYEADGTIVKHLHPGNAARDGILAALMARKGFTAPEEIIEGRLGFCHCFADECDCEAMTAGLGDEWQMLDIYFKPYCSCRYVHYAIECVNKVLENHPLRCEQIKRITVRTHRNAKQGSDIPEFYTPLHARTSIQHGISTILVNGNAGLAQYTDEAICDEQVCRMARRISVEFDEQLQQSYPDPRPMVVEVETTDGTHHAARVDYAKGDARNPMSDDELCAKFRDVTDGIVPDDAAQAIIDMCLGVQGVDDTGELMWLVGGAGRTAPPACSASPPSPLDARRGVHGPAARER